MKTKLFPFALFLLFALVLSGCTLLTTPPPPNTLDPNAAYTQAAQTIIAQMTKIANVPTLTPVANTPAVTVILPTEIATGMPLPSDTPVPTATSVPPTATAVPPTAVPPTATLVPPTPKPPTATATPVPCNWAQYAGDVTVKDGTEFTKGSEFTKTWLIKNIGSCTWTTKYDLVYVGGDDLDAPDSVNLPRSVKPGETVALSVELTAKGKTGTKTAYFQLRNDDGDRFGIGKNQDDSIWVEIKVIAPDDEYVYDFAANYCVADWESDADALPCPGAEGDEDGFVIKLNKPVLETGRTEDEPALWMQPQDTRDGWIRGEFPAFDVEAGQHFMAIVGCLSDAEDCKVLFQLRYRIDGGDLQTLWEVEEDYDGKYTRVDVDLSSLAGKEVEFVLQVRADGSARDDAAFWLAPRIVK